MLDAECSDYNTLNRSDFIIQVDSKVSIMCQRMPSQDGTTKGSVGLSQSKIRVGLEKGKVWQPSHDFSDCDFHLDHRTFPGT